MSVSAVGVLAFSPQLRWLQAGVSAAAAVIGGVLGALALNRTPDRPLRIPIIVIGVALTISLFLHAPR